MKVETEGKHVISRVHQFHHICSFVIFTFAQTTNKTGLFYFFFNQVRIFKRKGRYSCVTPSFDESAQYLFLSCLVGRVSYNSAVEPEPVTHELAIAENVIVRFTTLANPPRLDKYHFTVKPKKNFNTVQHPA